jgi:hypothetical protein
MTNKDMSTEHVSTIGDVREQRRDKDVDGSDSLTSSRDGAGDRDREDVSSVSSHWAASLGVDSNMASFALDSTSVGASGLTQTNVSKEHRGESTSSAIGVLSDRRLAGVIQMFCNISTDATFLISDNGLYVISC